MALPNSDLRQLDPAGHPAVHPGLVAGQAPQHLSMICNDAFENPQLVDLVAIFVLALAQDWKERYQLAD